MFSYMRMPILGATGMRNIILNAGLIGATDPDQMIAEMEQVIADPETYEISFTVTQVWGNKPLI